LKRFDNIDVDVDKSVKNRLEEMHELEKEIASDIRKWMGLGCVGKLWGGGAYNVAFSKNAEALKDLIEVIGVAVQVDTSVKVNEIEGKVQKMNASGSPSKVTRGKVTLEIGARALKMESVAFFKGTSCDYFKATLTLKRSTTILGSQQIQGVITWRGLARCTTLNTTMSSRSWAWKARIRGR